MSTTPRTDATLEQVKWEVGGTAFPFTCEAAVFPERGTSSLCYTTSTERAKWIVDRLNFARELGRELRQAITDRDAAMAAQSEAREIGHQTEVQFADCRCKLVEAHCKLNELERENAELLDENVKANGRLDMQMKELAALRADKERLDWLDKRGVNMKNVNWDGVWHEWEVDSLDMAADLRAAIDEARKA